MDRYKGAFFRKGCILAVASSMMWLAAFLVGITACAAGITFPPPPSAFVLPDNCAAGSGDFASLYWTCFASFMSCTLQACAATIPHWVLGSRKRLGTVPSSSSRWSRRFLFVSVVFFTLSFSCVVIISDLFAVVRVGKFACWDSATRGFVIAANFMAGLLSMTIFLAGSYISYYGY